jgi:DNA invertase Pin-like site-specific DNA recombinase
MKLDAYIRVSQVRGREGDSFISPDVQEERIRAWANMQGHEIAVAHRELDVSGGKMDRPLLNEVMRRIDAGETEGVVVHRLDRFGRTLVGAIQLIEHIRDRGALFASVSDNFDITTPTGELVLNILLSLAQFELRRIKENWSTARRRAVGRGIHVAGATPFGYMRSSTDVNPNTGRRIPSPLVPDPETAPLVAEIFRRRAAGDTWASIRDYLTSTGVLPPGGGHWDAVGVMQMVRKRAYLGEAGGAPKGEEGKPKAHPALIDEATWQAAQQRRGARHARGQSGTILAGLTRCAGCRYTMAPNGKARNGKATPGVVLQCCRGVRAGDCSAPAAIMAITEKGEPLLDDIVTELYFERLEVLEFEAVDEHDDIAHLEGELEQAQAKRDEDADDDELRQALGRPAWRKHLATLAARADEAQVALEAALAVAGRRKHPVAELRQQWPLMSVDDRRDHLARELQMLFVRSANGVPTQGPSRRDDLLARIHPVWVGEPTPVIPRQGLRGYIVKPFAFPDTNPDDAGVAAA